MPKRENLKLAINLDLLKPQSNPEKLLSKLFRWLISTGRYILVFVEALVLIVFIARFKLDGDLASRKEAIEEQIPYLESLKPFEVTVRQTQFKLSTIGSFYSNYVDFPQILKKIADQTPAGVKISSLNLEKNLTQVTIKLTGLAQNNTDLSILLAGLKQDQFFSDVTITGIGFEKGTLNFTINAQANLSQGGKNL